MARTTNRIHHTSVIRIETPPTLNEEAKTFCAELKPSMSATSLVPTLPVTCLVTARFRPRSMKNVPSVTRKLGMPVFTTR